MKYYYLSSDLHLTGRGPARNRCALRDAHSTRTIRHRTGIQASLRSLHSHTAADDPRQASHVRYASVAACLRDQQGIRLGPQSSLLPTGGIWNVCPNGAARYGAGQIVNYQSRSLSVFVCVFMLNISPQMCQKRRSHNSISIC